MGMDNLQSLLGIELPILQGAMGNLSSSRLAAAVCEAGGLGVIGVGTMPLEEIRRRIAQVRALTKHSNRLGLNLPIQVHPDPAGVLRLAQQEGIQTITLSAGNPQPYIAQLQAWGIKALVMVSTLAQAQKAEAAGANGLIVSGIEAAGMLSPQASPLLSILPLVTSQVSIPVIAAGGISDGRGLAAALILGASGVQLGTRLVATEEMEAHSNYKEALCKASDPEETLVVGIKWGSPRRLLKTVYAQRLLEQEQQQRDEQQQQGEQQLLHREKWLEWVSEEQHLRGALHGDLAEGMTLAGTSVGLIKEIQPVQVIFRNMLAGAQQVIPHLFQK
ncbi:NAD(P)H-dependent flavin oxidoreductase [Rubeoparvulum massiliense]|uniref:NAD(P)H-dependent flavin oxidoreductase n=1 Tax=Rubeoparvulum massiliense TaxID=1631346 RepID=UPI00065DDAF3|nr:nitronate monooxygenase [Rubeoparvulum massiliense]